MSISSEITRISDNIADAYSAANTKGATMPVSQNSDNLATTIATIPTGTTPTGTITITANGVYDVTDKATADVQVPSSAPAVYRPLMVNNGTITDDTNSGFMALPSNARDISNYIYARAYFNNINVTSVDLSGLTAITGERACYYMFSFCQNITSVDMSNVERIGYQSCFGMFNGSSISSIDLSNLKSVGQESCQEMFRGCNNLTTVDLSNIKWIETYGCGDMFGDCQNLTSVDLSGLQLNISGTYNAFAGCTRLANVNISGLISCREWGSFSSGFTSCTSLTSINFGSLVNAGDSCFNAAFNGCSGLTSVNLSKLIKIASGCFYDTFTNCTSLTTLSFNNLAYSTEDYSGNFDNMLDSCDGVTVHFPAEWQTDMENWDSVQNGFGGTNTTILWDLPNPTKYDLSHITRLDVERVFSYIFAYSTFPNLISVDLSNLIEISGNAACEDAFAACTSITSVDLSSLTTVSGSFCCYGMFTDCPNLASVDLSSLASVTGDTCMSVMFAGCTSLTELRFPSLKTVLNNSVFSNLLDRCNNVTVHFPSNLASYHFEYVVGGSGTTVLYDLPSTED